MFSTEGTIKSKTEQHEEMRHVQKFIHTGAWLEHRVCEKSTIHEGRQGPEVMRGMNYRQGSDTVRYECSSPWQYCERQLGSP